MSCFFAFLSSYLQMDEVPWAGKTIKNVWTLPGLSNIQKDILWSCGDEGDGHAICLGIDRAADLKNFIMAKNFS